MANKRAQSSPAQTTAAFVPRLPHVSVQRCRLIHPSDRGPGDVYEIDHAAVVGSSPECDIEIANRTISRRHFSIARDERGYLLRDLESTNGTFVDTYRVKELYLQSGATIEAGDARFRFELVSEPLEISPSTQPSFGGLIGRSEAMREVFAALEKISASESTILLVGETGTGKGATARSIHDASRRSQGPFVVFDCGATTPALVESELFGHTAGAFTGATSDRSGVFAEAAGGTLFIDELADLPIALQPKLLRALEEREFTPVGTNKPATLDCRIIAATQRDLWAEVGANRFRQDLYYRIAVVTVHLPALRQRPEDIPLLVDRFLEKFATSRAKHSLELRAGLEERMLKHAWPGNVRELRNVVERLCVMDDLDRAFGTGDVSANAVGDEGSIDLPSDDSFRVTIPGDLEFNDAKAKVIDAFEREYLRRLLERTEGNVSQAAREARMNRRHLYTLLAKHGLSRD